MESMDAHKWGPSPPADLEFLKIYGKIDYVLLELHLRFRAPADLVGKSAHMITHKSIILKPLQSAGPERGAPNISVGSIALARALI